MVAICLLDSANNFSKFTLKGGIMTAREFLAVCNLECFLCLTFLLVEGSKGKNIRVHWKLLNKIIHLLKWNKRAIKA
jgi:hypothetical protein